MRKDTRVRWDLIALTLALSMTRESAGAGPESLQPDYRAVSEYAQTYYLAYREEYGFLLRTKYMLAACDLEQLAAQVAGDVPKVRNFTLERLELGKDSSRLSTPEMSVAVIAATQNLTEANELAYLEAFKHAAKANSACTGVGRVYDTYLKSKEK